MPWVVTFRMWFRDAADFGEQDTDVLPALGHVDAGQLFDRQHEGVLLVHRRDVIEAVKIGDRLKVRLVLDQLLGAAVQQADVGIGALDDLAVQLQHQAQHPVGGRMLGAEVDAIAFDLGLGHALSPRPPRPREARNRCPPMGS